MSDFVEQSGAAQARFGEYGRVFREALAILAGQGQRAIRPAFGGSFLRHGRMSGIVMAPVEAAVCSPGWSKARPGRAEPMDCEASF